MATATSTPLPPDDALASARALRLLADRIEAGGVADAVAAGWTWAEIAEALGVTRQAAHKKHAKRLEEES